MMSENGVIDTNNPMYYRYEQLCSSARAQEVNPICA